MKTIAQIAKEIRAEVVGDEEPNGLCFEASEELRSALLLAGYKARLVSGTFYIDMPNPEFYDNDVEPESTHWATHHWVVVNGKIVDITADQFNDELEGEKFEAVTIGDYKTLKRYKAK